MASLEPNSLVASKAQDCVETQIENGLRLKTGIDPFKRLVFTPLQPSFAI